MAVGRGCRSAPTPNGSGEYINLQRDYGAVSNTDITTALQNVAADINAGSQSSYTVYLPGTGYTWSALINFTKPVKLVGDGFGSTTLRRTAAAAQIRFSGAQGSAVALTANGTANTSTLTMASTAAFSAGQYIVVRSSATELWSTAGANIGEIARVKSKTSTVLTLYAPLVYTHAFGNPAGGQVNGKDAQAVPLTLLTGCTVSGMRVYQNFGALTASNAVDQGLVRFLYCEGPAIEDVLMTGYDQFGVAFDTCVDPEAIRVRLRDSYWSNAGWWSYGILMRGPTRGGLVSQCFARNASLIGGGGDANGGPFRIRVADSGGTENAEDQSTPGVYKSMFELHGDCHEWALSDCYAESGNGWGAEVKGRDNTWDAFKAHDMSIGLVSVPGQSSGTRVNNADMRNMVTDCIRLSGGGRVSGGYAESSGGYGVFTSTFASPSGGNVVQGFYAKACGNAAVWLSATTDFAKNIIGNSSASYIGVDYPTGGIAPVDISILGGGAATHVH
jgi:hypothetical protein